MSGEINRTISVPVTVVFGGDATGVVHPLTGSYATVSVKQIRTLLTLLVLTGAVSVQLGYQLSSDEATWYDDDANPTAGSCTLVGSALTTATTTRQQVFTSIGTTCPHNRYLRLVALCKTTGGSSVVLATLTASLEIRGA
jgi:hypothetical protein